MVAINMFSMNQFIFLPNEEQMAVTLKELPGEIVKACYNNEIYKVDILKGPAMYVSKLIKDVQKKEMLQYKANKIQIKGVK